MYFKDKKTKLSLQNMFGYGAARGGGKPNFFQKKKARNVVSALYTLIEYVQCGVLSLFLHKGGRA